MKVCPQLSHTSKDYKCTAINSLSEIASYKILTAEELCAYCANENFENCSRYQKYMKKIEKGAKVLEKGDRVAKFFKRR